LRIEHSESGYKRSLGTKGAEMLTADNVAVSGFGLVVLWLILP
jgi:hypothetical protein